MGDDTELYRAVHDRRMTDQGVADVAGVERTTALRWRQKVEGGERLRIQPGPKRKMMDWLANEPSDFDRGYAQAVEHMREKLDELAKPSAEVPGSLRAVHNAGLLPAGIDLDSEDSNTPAKDDERDPSKRIAGEG